MRTPKVITNLHRKHIETMGTCGFCGMKDETTYHHPLTLHLCDWALEHVQNTHRSEVVCALSENIGKGLAREFLLQWGGEGRDPGKALAWVIETCYQLISGKQINSQTMSRQVKHWQLPGEVTVKINVDGAYHHKSNSGATRVVMCNNCGAMLAASAWWKESIESAAQR
jgi:hypothetical protein